MKKLILLLLLVFVSSAYAGNAVITWDAPKDNVDGSCYDDAGGFEIHYGTAPGTYTNDLSVPLNDPLLTCTDTGVPHSSGCGNVVSCTYSLSGLPDGTYYFNVHAVDTSSNHSADSNEASKTINVSPSACVLKSAD